MDLFKVNTPFEVTKNEQNTFSVGGLEGAIEKTALEEQHLQFMKDAEIEIMGLLDKFEVSHKKMMNFIHRSLKAVVQKSEYDCHAAIIETRLELLEKVVAKSQGLNQKLMVALLISIASLIISVFINFGA